MREEKTVCSNCDQRTNFKSIFCTRCGHNLHLPKKIQSIDEISYKTEIEKDYLKQYLDLTDKIKEFDGFEVELSQQKNHLDFLHTELRREQNTLLMLKSQVDAEKGDVTKLKQKKWGYLRAKLKGEFGSILEKEEHEYFDALNRLESSQQVVDELSAKITNADYQHKEILQVLETKKLLISQQKEIIYLAAEGIMDEEEDKIEMKLSHLTEKMEPYLLQKSKIQTSNSFVMQAIEFLSLAKEIIDINNSESEKMIGNGLLYESIKSSHMADVRNMMNLTKQMLNEANKFIKQTKLTRDIEPLEGTEFWENFLLHFIQDLTKGERMIKSSEIISRAMSQCNQISAWLKSQVSHMTLEVETILKEIVVLQDELLNHRIRIMENALNNQQVSKKRKSRKSKK